MRNIKCCLWGAAVMCLSATASLYGEDGDDDPAPIAGKTFKDIEAAFGEEHSRFWGLQSVTYDDPYVGFYDVEEHAPISKDREAFEEIKKWLEQQRDFGFFDLAQDMWMASWYEKTGTGRLKEVFLSYAPEGCVFRYGKVYVKNRDFFIRGVFGKYRVVQFSFDYKKSSFSCILALFQHEGRVQLGCFSLSCGSAFWRCNELFLSASFIKGIKSVMPFIR